ncbi:MAG TPA: tetratricopeptide repeat protein [Candidatus Angelobacter sp.]|nr:tetratricopeptide repeat protein [Candidatus Angelobacter sp.]
MTLMFAMISRWPSGKLVFRGIIALLAVFLASPAVRAQETSATALRSTNAPVTTTHFANGPIAPTNSLAAATNGPAPIAFAANTNAPAATNLAAQTSRIPSSQFTDPDGFSGTVNDSSLLGQLRAELEDARHLRLMRQPTTAEPILESLLTDNTPEPIQKSALLELALVNQDENNLVRAEQIYAQFVTRWSDDRRIPEVFLHEGQLYRQMGLNSLALSKFYSVMTAALALKNDQLGYYQKLVLDAQMEIAETHYEAGRFSDAADFFMRLLKQNSPALNRPEIQFRLIRSLQASGNYTETAAQARDYLARYPDSPNLAEARFCLALALKSLGQNNDSLQQVLTLLKEEKSQAREHPEVWAYWQQRTGNEIANQLYREGDYPRALEVYRSLADLDHTPAWQLPVSYQIGMTYERLLQPQMAMQTYSNLVSRQTELGTNAAPGLNAIIDMARWRIHFIQWQTKADDINHILAKDNPMSEQASKTSPPPTTAIP